MKIQKLLCCLLLIGLFTSLSHAQTENHSKRKMTIVTKTIDANGKETVTTVVKEGAEVTDEEIDRLIQKGQSEGKSIDVEVNLEETDKEQIIIKETGEKGVQKQYKIIKKIQESSVGEDGVERIMIIEDEEQDEAGENIFIEKSEDGESRKMLFISEDGEVTELEEDVQIIKKGKKWEQEIRINIETKEGAGDEEMIWIEKEGAEEGDVIIIEEETTEEMDKDGKTVKRTVKKTKKIVKKDGKN